MEPRDRWNRTPREDAVAFNHPQVVAFLAKALKEAAGTRKGSSKELPQRPSSLADLREGSTSANGSAHTLKRPQTVSFVLGGDLHG